MIRKTFLAAAALLAISAMGISPAKAEEALDINIGFGGGFLGKFPAAQVRGLSIAASIRLSAAIAAAATTSTRAAAMVSGISLP